MAEILYFGKIRERMGREQEMLSLPEGIATAEDLRLHLSKTNEMAACLLEASIRVVINGDISSWETSVTDQDSIAFIPPVSGG